MPDTLYSLKKIKEIVPEVTNKVNTAEKAIRALVRVDKGNEEAITRREVQERLQAVTDMHAATAASIENGATALAKLVVDDLENKKIKGVIVAGDSNTHINEPSKTGTDLNQDRMPKPLSCHTKLVPDTCGDRDGYDDTHHILAGGVVNGLNMIPVFTQAVPSYTGKGYAKSPIDNIYLAGDITSKAVSGRFLKGSGEVAFGSDHFPLKIKLQSD